MSIIVIVVRVEKAIRSTVLSDEDFSPHKVSDVLSLPGGETQEDRESYEEDDQASLTASSGWRDPIPAILVLVTADHPGTLLQSQISELEGFGGRGKPV